MIPILLDLHFIKIYTFGVFAAGALIWGCFVLWKHIKLTSFREEHIFDCTFLGLTGGLLISRIVFVAFHFKDFGFNVLKIILVNGYPGMSLIGFIVGLYVVVYFAFRRFGIEPKKGLDYTVTPLLISISLSKIGSFLSGVDVGTRTTLPLAVSYVGYGGARHITAFYEAILFLLAAIVARKMLFAVRRQGLPTGSVFYWFIFSFGAVVALLDKIKQNHLYLGHLTLNMVTGMALFIVGTAYFIITNRGAIVRTAAILLVSIKQRQHGSTIHEDRTGGHTEKTKRKTK